MNCLVHILPYSSPFVFVCNIYTHIHPFSVEMHVKTLKLKA